MSDQAIQDTSPTPSTPDLNLDTIRTLGRLLDDIEKVRIMNGNRIGALERAYGETLPHFVDISEAVLRSEHLAELELVRAWRRHPLAAWAKTQKGVGEKSIARLIAEIGDPLVGSTGHWETSGNGDHESDEAQRRVVPDIIGSEAIDPTGHNSRTPRTRTWIIDTYFDRSVSQLWQYCGVGDPARSKIPKGAVQAELMARGKPRAKKQLWLISTGMVKAGIRNPKDGNPSVAVSPWGEIYLERKKVTADRLHARDCPQCHAKTGDPWKPGHQNMDALRILAKEFLKALFDAAKALS